MQAKQQQAKQLREHHLMMLEALGVKLTPSVTRSLSTMREAIEKGKIDFLRKAQSLENQKL